MARPPDPSIDARVLAAAEELLDADALDALGNALSLTRVASRAGVDRHTVGRRFGTDDDLLLRVAEELSSLKQNGVEGNADSLITLWSTQHALPAEERLQLLFRLNFRAVVGWRSFRLGMLVQAAAVAGEASGDGSRKSAAQAVLDARRAMYEQMTSMLTPFLAVALRATGRRLVSGLTVEEFTAALNSLSDGLAMRHLLQPDLVTEDLAVRAMSALAASLTVPGVFHDPRRPGDEDTKQFELFRRAMEIGAKAAKDGTTPSLRLLGERLNGKGDVRFFFSSDAELVDSIRRWLVGQDDLWSAAKTLPDVAVIPAVRETLGSVVRMLEGYPGLARSVGESAFATDLREFVADLLKLGWTPQSKVAPDDLSAQLVDKALAGRSRESEWELMLDLLEHTVA